MGFSFSLGGSASKSKTTSNSTGSSTTNRFLPEWGAGPVQNATGRVNDLWGQDPYSLVAPAHALQTQAADGAANLKDWSNGYGESAEMMRGVAAAGANTYDPSSYNPQTWRASNYGGAQIGGAAKGEAGSLLDNLDAYMSPYRRDVVDAALADYDFGAGQTRAQQDLDLAGSGAFGGSGAALTRSMTEEGLVRGRATTSSNLLDQMFNRGAALSNLDADRRTQVSMGNAAAGNAAALSQAQLTQQAGLARADNLNNAARYRADAFNAAGQFNAEARNAAGRFNAGQQDGALNRRMEGAKALTDVYGALSSNQRANIATQASLGETFRGIDQQNRLAPVTQAQQIVAMLNGLPLGLFGGEQTNKTESSTQTGKTKEIKGSIGFGG